MNSFVKNAMSRRSFLSTMAAGGAAALTARCYADDTLSDFAYFYVSDTHYLADKENPGKIAAQSSDVCARFIDTLNKLPGSALPASVGGGTVQNPLGVIHGGDLIDTGDKNGGVTDKMQVTELGAFLDDYGLTGAEGRLKFPVYEIHGNHDTPQGEGVVLKKIIARNKSRKGVVNVSASGVHYAWNWGGVHFLNLGITVGVGQGTTARRRYNPLGSLDFLIADLKQNVGKPVIITHHVDIKRYDRGPDAPMAHEEWDSADVRRYRDALNGVNLVGIFYGHSHHRDTMTWNTDLEKKDSGVPLFNVLKASNFLSDKQAFFYIESSKGELRIRECVTDDRWKTLAWTPTVWKTPIKTGAK